MSLHFHQGLSPCLRRISFSILALLAICASFPLVDRARADSLVVQTCGTLPLAYAPGVTRNDTVDVNGNKCIAGTITATATTTATAASSLPTISAGSGAPIYESLAGAPYVQPVFASASGGGTQVDATHGLPVNIVAGSVTANAGTNLNTSLLALESGGNLASVATNTGTTNTDVGAPGATACSTDTGSCSLNALMQRLAQRLTTLNSTLNAPAQVPADACNGTAKTNLAINGNSTSSVQLIALSGSTSIYVCSLSLIAAGATTVAFTTGTGTACVTNNAAVIGSTTANIANSISLAANGGLTLGNGNGTVAKGVASSELCMILGSSVYVAGNLTYVQQ